MIVELYNTITNKSFIINVELNISTVDLFDLILNEMNVIIADFILYYRNQPILIDPLILLQDVVGNVEYVKFSIYPQMKTNTLYNTDLSGFNYIETMERIGEIEKFKKKKIMTIKRIKQKLVVDMRESKRYLEFEENLQNTDLGKEENQNTKLKMENILGQFKKTK